MKKKVLSAALGFIAAMLGACASHLERPGRCVDSGIQTRFDRQLPRLLADNGVASVGIAQIEAGRIVFVGAYGSQGPGVPASRNTLYNLASLSKPISAEVILRLASAGRLDLDEPMERYWTDPDCER